MGAWGLAFDDNDDASDWLGEFAEDPDWTSVDRALAVSDADFLEAPEASQALAAVEIVAAGLGKPSDALDDDLVEWAADEPREAKARRQDAILALRRVRDDSELQELWQDSDEFQEWLESIEETMARL